MFDISYIAGLVDADGCIRLHPSNKGKYRKYYPRVQITNTCRELMDALVEQFGGAIHGPKRRTDGIRNSTKDCWDWRITGDKCRQLLSNMIPFLFIKKEKAIKVLNQDNKQKENA